MKFIVSSTEYDLKLPPGYLKILNKYSLTEGKYIREKCYFIELKDLDELRELEDSFKIYLKGIEQRYYGLIFISNHHYYSSFYDDDFGYIEIYDDYRE